MSQDPSDTSYRKKEIREIVRSVEHGNFTHARSIFIDNGTIQVSDLLRWFAHDAAWHMENCNFQAVRRLFTGIRFVSDPRPCRSEVEAAFADCGASLGLIPRQYGSGSYSMLTLAVD